MVPWWCTILKFQRLDISKSNSFPNPFDTFVRHLRDEDWSRSSVHIHKYPTIRDGKQFCFLFLSLWPLNGIYYYFCRFRIKTNNSQVPRSNFQSHFVNTKKAILQWWNLTFFEMWMSDDFSFSIECRCDTEQSH